MKKIIVSVTNDLFSDNRVDKVCNSLTKMGFDVLLVGRKYNNSPTLSPRKYKIKRLHLFFKKGAAFYAEYNLRLFLYILFHKCDILVANDLDTLLANFMVSRVRRKKLVYDSHEYFCEVPELVNRPRIQKFWRRIEQLCFPKLEEVTTVCQSIADIYDKEYPRKSKVRVIKNVPLRDMPTITETRDSLNLPTDKRIIVMQGAINLDRGAEELICAMQWINNALLLIIGNGDKIEELKKLTQTLNLYERVQFIERQPYNKLFNYTYLADIGCSLEKNTNINYRYCLPNKLFDYIRANIPVVVSDLPEMAKVVRDNNIGLVIAEHTPEAIADSINKLLNDNNLYNLCKANELKASELYCWENEEQILREIYLG